MMTDDFWWWYNKIIQKELFESCAYKKETMQGIWLYRSSGVEGPQEQEAIKNNNKQDSN